MEAKCRIQDPVYGCVGIISHLHQQIRIAESQLAKTQAEIAVFNSIAREAQVQEIEADSNFFKNLLPEEITAAGLRSYGYGSPSTQTFKFN